MLSFDRFQTSTRPTPRTITRRTLLKLVPVVTGAALLAACQAAPPPPPPTPRPRPTRIPRKTASQTAAGARPAVTPAPRATAAPVQATGATGPLKVGVLAARSGVTAAVGQAGQRATEWWAKRVNQRGGVLDRPVELVVEEESSPKDTVTRFQKLVFSDKVDLVVGLISTGVSTTVAPVAEEAGVPLLMWDGTTQKGVEETITNPRWIFRSTDNEVEAIVAAILTAKFFKDVRTIVGINNDYSYGHDNWAVYQAVLKKYLPDVRFGESIFTKLGETEFSAHVATLQQTGADLVMCSFWSGDAPIFLQQAASAGLFKTMRGVFTTAGGVVDALKKDFTPEGLLIGYNTLYFDHPGASDLLKEFVKDYHAAYGEYPSYECDHAYFVLEAYRAAVERASKQAGGWPSKEQIVKALEGVEVESLSGPRRMREDHVMEGVFYQGLATHDNAYDFATIDPIEAVPTTVAMKPAGGVNLYDWIASWRIGPDGLPRVS
ncbi:MAG TPA: ABC transporter substrate-binding protein [Chloroflexota bacterium]